MRYNHLAAAPDWLAWRCYLTDRKFFGAPGRIRTADHLVRSQVLYPAELRAPARSLALMEPIGNLRNESCLTADRLRPARRLFGLSRVPVLEYPVLAKSSAAEQSYDADIEPRAKVLLLQLALFKRRRFGLFPKLHSFLAVQWKKGSQNGLVPFQGLERGGSNSWCASRCRSAKHFSLRRTLKAISGTNRSHCESSKGAGSGKTHLVRTPRRSG